MDWNSNSISGAAVKGVALEGRNVEQPISFSISWLTRLMRTRFDARARALGLTRSQWSMIATIRLNQGATQADLASLLEINSVTAGRIIGKLVSGGWIERRANPADLRVNRLYLRDMAEPVMASLGILAADEQCIATQGLSSAEQDILIDLLQRMIANLNTSLVSTPAGVDGEDLD